ncbi:carbohydrate deacetylase [soil metagenome]
MLKILFSATLYYFLLSTGYTQGKQTYAERLGWNKNDKIIILHVDDAGMSYDSNIGTIRAIEEGMANSASVMMTCPWVPGFIKYLKENPETDAGLHLTLTSEWEDYRWGPLVGKPAAPGLVDEQGALWRSVEQVVQHASPDEVEAEIMAQLERARGMGFEPTHLDSHMGTLFASPQFLERYIKVGISQNIPVMFPGGHNTAITAQLSAPIKEQMMRDGKFKEGMEIPTPPEILQARKIGKQIWDSGLPVLDDLHNTSYGWRLPEGVPATDENLRKMKTQKLIETIRALKPGITMVILHCTDPTEVFEHISGSVETRKGDLLAMLDPEFKRFIEEEGIILTTWREIKGRRDKIAAGN